MCETVCPTSNEHVQYDHVDGFPKEWVLITSGCSQCRHQAKANNQINVAKVDNKKENVLACYKLEPRETDPEFALLYILATEGFQSEAQKLLSTIRSQVNRGGRIFNI